MTKYHNNLTINMVYPFCDSCKRLFPNEKNSRAWEYAEDMVICDDCHNIVVENNLVYKPKHK